MGRLPAALLPMALMLAWPISLAAADTAGSALAGTLSLVERGVPVSEAADAVVWYVPASGVAPPAPARAEVQTRERRFIPRVTVVPVGSEVWFPNSDPILHNVFSVSAGNRFDLGLYRKGPGKAARILKAGLVRVYCNVHQAMSAFVLALDTPYVARPGPDGRFALDGLPPGEGTLYVWHERANVLSRVVTLPHEAALAVTLELDPAGQVAHLDKNGRPYRESKGNDEYR
jgi:plastocyanin